MMVFRSDVLQKGSRGAARKQRSNHDSSPSRDHLRCTYDLLRSIISALHQHIWEETADESVWRILVEDGNHVHGGHCGQDHGTVFLGVDGPVRPLEPADRSIGIQADDERVSESTRRIQELDMAAVKDIEAAIGKHHRFLAWAVEAAQHLRDIEDLLLQTPGLLHRVCSGRGRLRKVGTGGMANLGQDSLPSPPQEHAGELLPHRARVLGGPGVLIPEHVGPFQIRDQPVQNDSLILQACQCSDGDLASPLQSMQEGALGLGADSGGRVGERTEERARTLIIGTGDDSKRTLSDGRQPEVRLKVLGDPLLPPQPQHPGGGQNDRLVIPSVQACAAGVQVAAEVHHLQVGTERPKLRPPPQGAGPHPCPGSKILEAGFPMQVTEENISRILAPGDGGELQPRGKSGGHVFEGVDGKVRLSRKEYGVDLLGEEPPLADTGQGHIEDAVPGGADYLDLDLDLWSGGVESIRDGTCLPERQLAPPGGDAQRPSHDVTTVTVRPRSACVPDLRSLEPCRW